MIQHRLARNITNFVLFQCGWLLCVLYPGISAALAIVSAHLILVSQHKTRELQFILLGTVLGSLLDGFWFQFGVLREPGIEPNWTPFWLVGVWAVFMTTLAHSLAWMGNTRWLPFVLAPLAGPFAYWSAVQLGTVEFPNLTVSLVALAVGWGLLFPALMTIKSRFYPEITPP
jgi:hypothetical protein